MTVGINDLYQGGRKYNPIDSGNTNLKTGTFIQKATSKGISHPEIQGSVKRIVLGENSPLRALGVDRIDIHRLKNGQNQLEPCVRFYGPKGNHSQGIGFWMKSENAQMKAFIKALKDLPKGTLPDFASIGAVLKHIK